MGTRESVKFAGMDTRRVELDVELNFNVLEYIAMLGGVERWGTQVQLRLTFDQRDEAQPPFFAFWTELHVVVAAAAREFFWWLVVVGVSRVLRLLTKKLPSVGKLFPSMTICH